MKSITANRLLDGEVVFWNAGAWKTRFGDAERFANDDAAQDALTQAHQPTVVVEPYLIDVVAEEGGFAPVAYRERIRALGPQNHPQHGKQAEGGADIEVIQRAEGVARSAGRHNLISKK